jgi:hypothetical protein
MMCVNLTNVLIPQDRLPFARRWLCRRPARDCTDDVLEVTAEALAAWEIGTVLATADGGVAGDGLPGA